MKLYMMSPYTHPDPFVRHLRWIRACTAAGLLIKEGHIVFSPIAHSHGVASACDLDGTWDFWKPQDESFIRDWADAGVVLLTEGWDKSVGIENERKLFDELGLPVFMWNHLEGLPDGLKTRG